MPSKVQAWQCDVCFDLYWTEEAARECEDSHEFIVLPEDLDLISEDAYDRPGASQL